MIIMKLAMVMMIISILISTNMVLYFDVVVFTSAGDVLQHVPALFIHINSKSGDLLIFIGASQACAACWRPQRQSSGDGGKKRKR